MLLERCGGARLTDAARGSSSVLRLDGVKDDTLQNDAFIQYLERFKASHSENSIA